MDTEMAGLTIFHCIILHCVLDNQYNQVVCISTARNQLLKQDVQSVYTYVMGIGSISPILITTESLHEISYSIQPNPSEFTSPS